jgi:hypothetical protein
MARVRHPHVVRVHEVGQSSAGPYFVCELVDGQPLDELAADAGLPAREVARLGRGIADGLVACHAEGIVHRDLKPANIVVRPDGSPVIIDFGVARDEQAASLTEAGALLGTPAYMAPEQVSGGKIDHRTDLYGLGATLFACLAGRPPFESTGAVTGLLTKVVLEEPSWPTSRVLPVPPGLERIIRRAMAKAPDDRYPDAAALREDLDRWLAVSAGASPFDPKAAARPPRGARALLAALTALAVLAALTLALVVARGGPAEPRPRPATTRPTPTAVRPPPTTPTTTPPATEPLPPALARPGELVRRLDLPAADPEGDTRDVRATFLEDGSILAGLSDGSVVRWRSVDAPPLRLALDPTFAFTAIVPLGAGRACLGTRTGALVLVRTDPPAVTRLAGLPPEAAGGSYVWAVAHDPGSDRVAASLGTLPSLDRTATSVGRLLLGRLGPAGLEEVQTIGDVKEPAQGLSFSDDGAWLGVAWGVGLSRDRGVLTVHLADGRLRPFAWSNATPRGAVFVPGTHRFAVGSTDGLIRAADLDLDPSNFELLVAEPGDGLIRTAHPHAVLTLTVRGRRLASASWELDVKQGAMGKTLGDVRVWDLDQPDGRQLLLTRAGVRHLSFSPRADQLLVSGDQGLLEVWAVGPP